MYSFTSEVVKISRPGRPSRDVTILRSVSETGVESSGRKGRTDGGDHGPRPKRRGPSVVMASGKEVRGRSASLGSRVVYGGDKRSKRGPGVVGDEGRPEGLFRLRS